MSYSFGKNFKVTLFGQSHSSGIGLVIDGIEAGYKINRDLIAKILTEEDLAEMNFQVLEKKRTLMNLSVER